MRVVLGSDSLV